MAIGYEISIVTIAVDWNSLGQVIPYGSSNNFNHVFLLVNTEAGWIFSDTINKNKDFGWSVPAENYTKRRIYVMKV